MRDDKNKIYEKGKKKRKLKRHAKWAGLDLKNPKEKEMAIKTYEGLMSPELKKGGKIKKSNYNGFDIQPS